MRPCTKCKEEKEPFEFNKDATKRTGRHPHCKTCQAAVARRWYLKNRDLAIRRARLHSLKNPENRKVYIREWARQNRAEQDGDWLEKHAAHQAVHKSVSRGDLKRLPCEKCGEETAHAHHEDYSKPLDVVWLCRSCHGERHREINDERESLPT